jgi:2-C-methyl-D-erythritol 4-phosphate cytidylyltransferase
MKKFAIIVAAGTGTRMGTDTPKQFLELKGRAILEHTLARFLEAFPDLEVILVLNKEWMQEGKRIADKMRDAARIKIVEGGETRFQSVQNGLGLVTEPGLIAVHDAVRCLVSVSLIRHCYGQAAEYGMAIPAVPAKDSIRVVGELGAVAIERDQVRIIQTPQTFRSAILLTAFDQPYDPAFTDEATVVEKTGVTIKLVEGEETNIKITLPIDLLIAEKILEEHAKI